MRLHSWAPVAIAAVAVVVVAALAVAIVQVRTPAQPPRSGVSARPSGTPTAAATRDAVAAPVAPTRLHRVAPVTAAGRVAPGYRVTVSGPGHCFSTSLFDDRLWRCFRGNTILDPCWQAGPRTVLCLPVPWSRQVTRVRLTAHTPAQVVVGALAGALVAGTIFPVLR